MFDVLAISDHPGLGESLRFLLTGFTIVVLTLLVLALITSLAGKLLAFLPVKPAAVRKARTVEHPVAGEKTDSQLLAAITAAVHTVCQGPVRVAKVVPLGSDQAWSREGRRQIHESHNLRK